MPNWTANKIIVSGDKDEINRFLDTVGDPEAERDDDKAFDFNRIIPMPAILKRTHSGGSTIEGQEVRSWFEDEPGKPRLPTEEEKAEFERIGYSNWYDWSCANWGTKWSACHVEVDASGADFGIVEVMFDTAWCRPAPIFRKLRAMFPMLAFTFRWRDEGEDVYPHEASFADDADDDE